MSNFTFIDLFSGIGGFRQALVKNGGKSLGFSEINKIAIEYYHKNYDTSNEINFGDITKINNLPYCDILTAGVPCQSWSIAGNNLGFNDSRGVLWNDTIRLLNISKPKYFIFENVKGLTFKTHKKEFDYILSEISKVGYYVKYFILNSRNFDVSQDRERLYIIGFRNINDYENFNIKKDNIISNDKYFIFSDVRNGCNTIHSWDIFVTTINEKNICNLLLNNRRKKIYGNKDGNPLSFNDLKKLDDNVKLNDILSLIDKKILKQINDKYDFKNSKISSGIDNIYRIYHSKSNIYPTLVASNSNDYVTDEDINISKIDFINKIYKPHKFRKLTKTEACILQSFPKDFILPDKNWQKLLGNSVTVNVIDYIIKKINKL